MHPEEYPIIDLIQAFQQFENYANMDHTGSSDDNLRVLTDKPFLPGHG